MEKITVEAKINAPLQKVWDLYTQPEHIIKWNQASDDWHTTKAENDLKTGGKFLSRMEAKDGSAGFDFEGVYDEVNELSSMKYTMDDGRKVDIDMVEEDGSTKVTVVFDPESDNDPEFQKSGWQAILDNFKKYVE